MRNLVPLALTLVLALPAVAQSPDPESLQREARQAAEGGDVRRAEGLYRRAAVGFRATGRSLEAGQAAYQAITVDPARHSSMTEQRVKDLAIALRLAREANDQGLLVQCLLEKLVGAYHRAENGAGTWAEAGSIADETLAAADALGKPEVQAGVLLMAADAAQRTSPRRAVELHARGERLAADMGNGGRRARHTTAVGVIVMTDGLQKGAPHHAKALEDARTFFLRAEVFALDAGDAAEAANAAFFRGLSHTRAWDPQADAAGLEKARSGLGDALRSFEEAPTNLPLRLQKMRGRAYVELASLCEPSCDPTSTWARAAALYDRGRAVFETAGLVAEAEAARQARARCVSQQQPAPAAGRRPVASSAR